MAFAATTQGRSEEAKSDGDSLATSDASPIWMQVYKRLVEIGHKSISSPYLGEELQAHFERLSPRYAMDIDLERVEDVLIHKELLELAIIPENRPVFHVSMSERMPAVSLNRNLDQLTDGEANTLRHHEFSVERQLNFEDLVLDSRNSTMDVRDDRPVRDISVNSLVQSHVPLHEVTFSTIDKPKLLSQLSSLLGDIGLNIREAHAFSTSDGYSLDVFLVDGWHLEDTSGLHKALEDAIANTEKESWIRSSSTTSPIKSSIKVRRNIGDCEVDKRLLKLDKKIASGSCGNLYRGTYMGQDVAVKVLKPERLNKDLEYEFAQEVLILRNVKHKNVVQFIGACTQPPHLCMVTEYMSGGSLYDYLHKQECTLRLPTLVKYAIDVSKGMEYLHENHIIHRDLKAANLLMDKNYVVKIADFGVARFLTQSGLMTAETGTYRWMAPEVINHQPYDQKADVFSFAIVLWELLTAKLPYESMTPLQAALGVRQGLRPPIPEATHPKIARILKGCWEEDPSKRPSFLQITAMLEEILEEVTDLEESVTASEHPCIKP